MSTREVLRRASALVEAGWTQGLYARDRYGHGVSALDERAVRWCIYGAIDCAAGKRTDLMASAVRSLHEVLGKETPAHWNDHLPRSKKSQALVAQKLREAAEA